MSRRESTIWAGRPSLRPLFLNPVYLACWAIVGYFLRLWYLGLPLPTPVTLPQGWDPRLVAPAIVALPLLWWPLTVLTTRFELTSERLLVAKGILNRTLDEIELYRVRDVRLTKGILQRIVGLGTVHVGSNDGTGTLAMPSIAASARVREAVRQASEESKRQRGVTIAT